jgi:hypothetical protein
MNHSPITRIYPGQQTFSVTQAAAILGVHWTTVWRRAKSRPGQAKGIDIIKTPFGHRVTRAEIGRIRRPLDDADLYGCFRRQEEQPAAGAPGKSLTSRRASLRPLHGGEAKSQRQGDGCRRMKAQLASAEPSIVDWRFVT